MRLKHYNENEYDLLGIYHDGNQIAFVVHDTEEQCIRIVGGDEYELVSGSIPHDFVLQLNERKEVSSIMHKFLMNNENFDKLVDGDPETYRLLLRNI